MENYHFLVMGSDMRQQYLAELLLEKGNQVTQGEYCQGTIYNAALLPVSATEEFLEANLEHFSDGQLIYGCNFPSRLDDICRTKNFRCVDYMSVEGIAERNAIAASEGAIVEALLAGELCIDESCCLVTGYGRVGSVLASKLKAFNAETSVMDLNIEKLEEADQSGYAVISMNDSKKELHRFNYIFNTVPALVFTEPLLKKVDKDAVIIDIASKPGGVDYEYCRKHHINANHCLGLPGKYMPRTAALTLLNAIEKSIRTI